jgi:uncharacterized membrane-anchored protein YhcB (DUF1043 family)
MFLAISQNKVSRFFSSDPPRLEQVYHGSKFTTADAGFAIGKLLIGLEIGDLDMRNLFKDRHLKTVKKVHKKIMGIVFMPHINYFATSGDKIVKLFDRNLNLKETLKESKEPVSKLMYKTSDMLLGALNTKGIVFWKLCDLKHCLACKTEKVCMKCKEGYGLTSDGKCNEIGSENSPIKWSFQHTNVDRTSFKIKFEGVGDEQMGLIDSLHPGNALEFDTDLTEEQKLNMAKIYELKFTKDFELREWDINCRYLKGFGMRNLSVNMRNETLRILGAIHPETRVRNRIFFAPGPKYDSIPSMPAWRIGIRFFTRSLALIFKVMLYLTILFIVIDLFCRWCGGTSLKGFRLLRYAIFYFGMTSLILFTVNYRPAVTEAFRGYFRGVHSGYFFWDQFQLDSKSLSPIFFNLRNKAVDYGVTLLTVDRNLIGLSIYAFSWIVFGVLFSTKVSKFFNSIRFLVGNVCSFNFLMSGLL